MTTCRTLLLRNENIYRTNQTPAYFLLMLMFCCVSALSLVMGPTGKPERLAAIALLLSHAGTQSHAGLHGQVSTKGVQTDEFLQMYSTAHNLHTLG